MEPNVIESQGTKSSPWDIFIHLFAVVALYLSIYAVIKLLFSYIRACLSRPA